MEELKENHICLFCNELTTSHLKITEDINSIIVTMFDRENIPLFNFYLCSECHTRVIEAKGILAHLDQLQSRLQVITTNLRNLMSETETITSNTTEARSQLLNSTVQIDGDPEILDPLSLEEEAFCNDNDDDNCYELGSQGSDSKPSLADIQGCDSHFAENDESNYVSDFDPSSDIEDPPNTCVETKQFRSRQFSEEESRVLWKEYLRQRRKTKNGTVSIQNWKKIARIVSKVNKVTRTPLHCQDKVHNLKVTLKKAAGKNGKKSKIPVWLEKEQKSDEDEGQTSESEPEETGTEDSKRSSVKARQFRSRPFSDEESRVLWKQYLRQRRKTENGTLSIQIWAKIARIVSKVNKVSRTPLQCKEKVHSLKATFRKAAGKKDGENIPVWLNYEEEEKNSSQSESEPEDTFNVSNLNKSSTTHFSISEIRILWDEYMKRRSEIKTATRHTATKIWTEIAVIVSSRCKANYTSIQCRRKVENILYDGRDPNHGTPESGHHLDNRDGNIIVPEILPPPPSVYTIHTQNGSVELKTAVLELTKCDLVQQYKSSGSSTPTPNARIKKLRDRLLRRKKAMSETLKKKEKLSRGDLVPKKRSTTSDLSYECSNCLQKFNSKAKLKLHAKTHEIRHNCLNTTCTLSFQKIVELESHIQYQHTEIERGHTCETRGCWRKFYTEEGLKYHHQRCHDESTKNFVCEVCAMKFFTLKNLKNHCYFTHNAQPYTCEYCNKVYRRKADLLGHQAKMHGSMDPQKFKPELQTCNICGYIVQDRKYLDRHMKKHTKNYEFYCSVPGCNFGTATMSSLKNHLYKHDPTPQHQCQFCPAKFRYRGGLLHHMRIHTGIKSYKCEPCGEEFSDHSNWKNHNEIHHMPPEIRYQCIKCGTGFTACKNYQNHRQKCG